MAVQLQRIEALPRAGQYLVTVRSEIDAEATLVMTITDGTVTTPQATLPPRWTVDTEPFVSVAAAVLAMDRARRVGPQNCYATDVPGGWDVSLGNVKLTRAGVLACAADGPMAELGGGLFECATCGARGLLVVAGSHAP